jgi:hypothetical protein
VIPAGCVNEKMARGSAAIKKVHLDLPYQAYVSVTFQVEPIFD